MTRDIHNIDWAVLFISWANFGPEEHALGGVTTLKIALGLRSTKAKTYDGEVL